MLYATEISGNKGKCPGLSLLDVAKTWLDVAKPRKFRKGREKRGITLEYEVFETTNKARPTIKNEELFSKSMIFSEFHLSIMSSHV
jgi:hypothetical protein